MKTFFKFLFSSTVGSITVIALFILLSFYDGLGYGLYVVNKIGFYWFLVSVFVSILPYLIVCCTKLRLKLKRLIHYAFAGIFCGFITNIVISFILIFILILADATHTINLALLIILAITYIIAGFISGLFYYLINGTKTSSSNKSLKHKENKSYYEVNNFIKKHSVKNAIKCVSFVFIATCHPVIFIIILFSPFGDYLTYDTSSTNVDKIRILPFITIATITYLITIAIQYIVLKGLLEKLSFRKFFDVKLKKTPLIISAFGFYHIQIWFFSGMEGNIMGFIFFPYLILLSIAYFITLTIQVAQAFKGKYNYD